jgi:Tol biopolymer transport system component
MARRSRRTVGCLLLVGGLSWSCSSSSDGSAAGPDAGSGGTHANGGDAGSAGQHRAGASSGAATGNSGSGGSATAGDTGDGGLGGDVGLGGEPAAGGTGNVSADAGAGGAPPVNTPPFVDPVPDAGIVLGQTLTPVVVHVSDDFTPPAALIVTAVSDNPSLLKSANIVVGAGASGEYRTLSMTFEANQTGSAVVTVRGEDGGGLFRLRSFKVTVLAAPASQTELVSRSSTPSSVIGNSFSLHPSLSADGRLVAFSSAANNLVAGDAGANQDVFVYDRQTQLIKRLTKNSGSSIDPVISADGKHVAFSSDAANLVVGDTNALSDVFVYDLATDVIERVSVADNEAQADAAAATPDISADGNWIVWSSAATNLVSGDSNGKADIFVRNRSAQTTLRVSVSSTGVESNADAVEPQISDDGTIFAFQSQATTLIDGSTDPNSQDDIFLRSGGATRRLSRNPLTSMDGDGASERPALSGDGKTAAFASSAKNLVTGDNNGKMDVFVYDLVKDTLERVSLANDGSEVHGLSTGPALSTDGSVVVFDSLAFDLVGANNGYINCYLAKRGPSLHVSLMNGSDFGGFANGSTNYRSVVSGDGKWVAFHSAATNLVVGDNNGSSDVFVTPAP